MTADHTEQAIREERWKRMTKPQEHFTGHAQLLKRGGEWVLQHQWKVSEWVDGMWTPRAEWRDVPKVDEESEAERRAWVENMVRKS